VTCYWEHGDLSTRDYRQLEQRNQYASKPATITTWTPEEIAASTDFTSGPRHDLHIGSLEQVNVLHEHSFKGLFDPKKRAAWKNARFSYIYGDMNPWNVIYGVWTIEEKLKDNPELHIDIKTIPGSNHMVSCLQLYALNR
jgi:hypothetical protein